MLKNLLSLFRSLVGGTHARRTVIVVDRGPAKPSREYTFRHRHLRIVLLGVLLTYTVVVAAVAPLTPLRALIPGYLTPEMLQNTRMIALRMASLEDSLAAHEMYLSNLRLILTGELDSTLAASVISNTADNPTDTVLPEPQNWQDHVHPALPITVMPANMTAPQLSPPALLRNLESLQLPALAPVDGFVTHGFDARTGHFAIDIATEAGTMVRCIGDGYVVFADWTYTGGHTIIVQHANGFLSVYKHNEQLLKQVADRVSVREGLAISGNSGEFTTGPHLHFELWNNGLAQDPGAYLLGL